MASACVNSIGISPENFLDCAPSYQAYSWFNPRISFSGDFADEESMIDGEKSTSGVENPLNLTGKHDVGVSVNDIGDFEFRLEDPVTMLTADELFSCGKLVPLQLTTIRPSVTSRVSEEMTSPDRCVKSSRNAEISGADPYLSSPKAPRCSSGWKELLRLKKIQNPKNDSQKSSSVPWKNLNPQSLKLFLHRNPKSDSSLISLPLLRDSDLESVSISSGSGADHHEEVPRFSLDSSSDKTNPDPISLNRRNPTPPPRKVRLMKSRTTCEQTGRMGRSPMRRVPDSNTIGRMGVSIDSPRMNSCGKVVFQSLERSSSSPSSFNGGPKIKHKGMERCYSANVRVLNVPVCSLIMGSSKSGSVFGFGQLFTSSAQKRDASVRNHSNRNRNDRIW